MEITEIVSLIKDSGITGAIIVALYIIVKNSRKLVNELAHCIVEEMRDELKMIYADFEAIRKLAKANGIEKRTRD